MQTDETSLKISGPIAASHTVAREWRDFFAPWWLATLAVLPIFLLTRLLFLLLSYLEGIIFNVPPGSSFALTSNTILYGWYHWDVTHYLSIAMQGYLEQAATAYFPLYPALVHACSALLHLNLLLTSMLIANLAFLGALIVLYRFVSLDFDPATAWRSILYLTIFPTALFSFAAYAEPLFLFFILLCCYALRREKWWLAGLCGALAALTRAEGILLFIIFLCEFFRQQGRLHLRNWREQTLRYSLRALVPACAALLIPLALTLYAFGLKRQFADPLAFLHPQPGLSSLSRPWSAPLAALHNLTNPFTFAAAHSLFELFILAFLLILFVMSFFGKERLPRRLWPFQLFMFLLIIFALLLPTLPATLQAQFDPLSAIQSIGLESFVGFILLARLGRRSWLHQGYLLLALPLLTFMVVQIISNHWTM